MDRAIAVRAVERVATLVGVLMASLGLLAAASLLQSSTGRAARCVLQWQETLENRNWAYIVFLVALPLLGVCMFRPAGRKTQGPWVLAVALLAVGAVALAPTMVIQGVPLETTDIVVQAACGMSETGGALIMLTSMFPVVSGLVVVALSRPTSLPISTRVAATAGVALGLGLTNAFLIEYVAGLK